MHVQSHAEEICCGEWTPLRYAGLLHRDSKALRIFLNVCASALWVLSFGPYTVINALLFPSVQADMGTAAYVIVAAVFSMLGVVGFVPAMMYPGEFHALSQSLVRDGMLPRRLRILSWRYQALAASLPIAFQVYVTINNAQNLPGTLSKLGMSESGAVVLTVWLVVSLLPTLAVTFWLPVSMSYYSAHLLKLRMDQLLERLDCADVELAHWKRAFVETERVQHSVWRCLSCTVRTITAILFVDGAISWVSYASGNSTAISGTLSEAIFDVVGLCFTLAPFAMAEHFSADFVREAARVSLIRGHSVPPLDVLSVKPTVFGLGLSLGNMVSFVGAVLIVTVWGKVGG